MTIIPTILEDNFEIIQTFPGDRPLKCFHVRSKKAPTEDYILRILPEDLCQEQELLDRFHAFFQKYQQISRPSLPQCHCIEIRGNLAYVLEEFIDGRKLGSYVQESSWATIAQAIDQVCDALHYAHMHSIFHTCVTPADILVKGDRTVLVGFGTAIFLYNRWISQITGNIRRFIAPEGLGCLEVDASADIFSLACAIRECLPETSTHPVIVKALNQNKDDRFQSIRVFQSKLQEVFRDKVCISGPEPRPLVLKLRIMTKPEGATIKVDGSVVGVTSAAGLFIPWRENAEILVEKEGFQISKLNFHDPPSESELNVRLDPLILAATPIDVKKSEHPTVPQEISPIQKPETFSPRRTRLKASFWLPILGLCGILIIAITRLIWFFVNPPSSVPTAVSVKSTTLSSQKDKSSRNAQDSAQQNGEAGRQIISDPGLVQWKKLIDDGEKLYKQAKYSQAELLFKQALKVSQELFTENSVNYAKSQNSLGLIYYRLGNCADAENLFHSSLSIQEQILGMNHVDLAPTLLYLGDTASAQGEYLSAEAYYKRALQIKEQPLALNDREVGKLSTALGCLYVKQRKLAEAESLFKRAISIEETNPYPSQLTLAESLQGMASVFKLRRKLSDAEVYNRRALSIREKELGPEHPDTAESLVRLGNIYMAWGNYSDAEAFLKRALSIKERALGPESRDVAEVLNSIGDLKKGLADSAAAENFYLRAIAIREKCLGSNNPMVAYSWSSLALLYYSQKRYSEAKLLYEKALWTMERSYGPDHPDVKTIRKNLKALAKY